MKYVRSSICNERELKVEKITTFDGIRLEPAVSKISVISKSRYDLQENEFGRNVNISPPTDTQLRGTGGHQKVNGLSKMQKPFNQLGMFLDFVYEIITCVVPNLLWDKDMIDKVLRPPPSRKFLGNRRTATTAYVRKLFPGLLMTITGHSLLRYTEDDLININRRVWHPYVNSAFIPLKRNTK